MAHECNYGGDPALLFQTLPHTLKLKQIGDASWMFISYAPPAAHRQVDQELREAAP